MNPFKRHVADNTKFVPAYIPKPNLDTDFPVLVIQNNNSVSKETGLLSFSEIASKPIEEKEILKNNLAPGWISLEYKNNKFIRKENNVDDKNNKKISEHQELQENMNKTLIEIEKRRQKYIEYYNEIHGEGEYEENFVYKESYVSSEEEEEDLQEENDIYEYQSN